MKPNRLLLFLVSTLIIVFLFPVLVLSQNGEITYFEYKIIQNINLTNNVSDIKTINMFWIDENRLLFQADRQVSLIINPNNPNETLSKGLTNYLWVLGENRLSHFTYIKDLDIIMLVEETPPKLLVFDGKGENYKIIAELSGEDYKAEFIKSNRKVLIFANKEIAFYDYASNRYEVAFKNVGRYTYYPETNELLVFYNIGKETDPNKRKRYDVAVIDISTLKEKIKITEVTDALYYPKASKLFYSKPETFHNTSLVEVNYPSKPDEKKTFTNKIGYKDFFDNERFTDSGEIRNKMSLTYSKENSVYIWTEPYDTPADTKTITEKKLTFTEDPYNKDKIKYSIDNVLDYIYNPIKNDILIFKKSGAIEKINLASPNDKVSITTSSAKTGKVFYWFKEKNIIVYLEGDKIKSYDLENNKELFSIDSVNTEAKINVSIVDDELIALSYINKRGKGVGQLYHIKHNILTEIKEEVYFIKPFNTYGTVATLRKHNESDTAVISFYECEAHTDEPPTKESVIGPFGLGFKIGGAATSMLVIGNILDFGFEFTIFINMTIAKTWMIELGVGIGSRFFSFDDDVNPGLANDSRVNTVLLSVNLLGRYMFPVFYIPFGVRTNFLLYTDITVTMANGSTGVFAFDENVNLWAIDIVAGGGVTFPITKQMDLFIELLVMFNVAPALFKSSFITDPDTTTLPEIEGRDLIFQVNIGLNLFKFGKIEDKEIDALKNRFQIGAKVGTNLNTMFVYAAEVAFGYELSVFGGIKLADNWLLGLDILFGGRNESFNQERGNLPSEYTIVNTTLFGLQASGRYIFDFSGKGLENKGANGLFIPFGLRANFNFYNTMTVQTGTFDFTNYVNPVSMDIFAGVGYIFYITDKMDIFGELLLVFNVAPAFFKPNFTTVTQDSSRQIDGRYFGIQLNIGFTFLKF